MIVIPNNTFTEFQYTLQFSSFFSDDLHEKEIEIKLEISKKAGLLKKPVRFTDVDARIDEAIPPNESLWNDYIDKNPVHRCIQVSAEMSHHEVRLSWCHKYF